MLDRGARERTVEANQPRARDPIGGARDLDREPRLPDAGIGSAVNDTTRELGGALGVAIVGSIVSSLYSAGVDDRLPEGVPAPVADVARESLGAAVHGGPELADVARDAFLHAMSWGSMVVAGITVLGALIAWRALPDRAYGHAHAHAGHDA